MDGLSALVPFDGADVVAFTLRCTDVGMNESRGFASLLARKEEINFLCENSNIFCLKFREKRIEMSSNLLGAAPLKPGKVFALGPVGRGLSDFADGSDMATMS